MFDYQLVSTAFFVAGSLTACLPGCMAAWIFDYLLLLLGVLLIDQLSHCMLVQLHVWLPVCLTDCWVDCLSVRLSICMPAFLPTSMPVGLCLFVCRSAGLAKCILAPTYQDICLPVLEWLFFTRVYKLKLLLYVST